ncbi:fimbrial protein [Buttiauxella sp.]|uniref:fimbrial protein n=1 Tax=Buttiauxella sp. TaxID=1972222 RepID=UPI003C772083
MFNLMKRLFAPFLSGLVICLMHFPAQSAVTVLNDCFGAPQDYYTTYSRELEASENTTNNEIEVTDHLAGNGADMEANCTCPKNMDESTPVNELTLAGSPLNPGVSGYGFLTDKIDVDIDGYTDAVNSPEGAGLLSLHINEYPTPRSSMPKQIENIKTPEGTASVCSTETRPQGGTSVKRKFRWSVIGLTLYIKKAILGIETLPSTLVMQHYACLYFGAGNCNTTSAQQVSNIWLSGSLSAPLGCTINEGSTIEIELGNIISSQFVNKGQPPEGYSLKNVDISYHCDNNAVGNQNRIKLTLTADQGVVSNSNALIANMIDRDDIGVRIFNENNQNVALDGNFEFEVPMDELGNGTIQIKAAPVSTTSSKPEPGAFEGNITVKMDIR